MNGEKESNGETSSGSKGKLPAAQSVAGNWNASAARGKVSDRCFWTACKAMTAGFLFIIIGATMATMGFYSDHLSRPEDSKGNTTVWVKNDSKDSPWVILTYLGPIVMGIGGFTIVAACVMTFEARDTASKIVPIWFKRTRIHVVSGGSGSTPSGRSSKTSWEKFLCQQRSTEDAEDNRTAVTQALVNFSKYLQNSVDTNKIPFQRSSIKSQQGMRKCPSEPNIAKPLRDNGGNALPDVVALLEASTPQPSQRTTYGGGLKTISGASKPQLLSVAPDTYRQAVSMDCPRSRHDEEDNDPHIALNIGNPALLSLEKPKIQTLPFQTSCATSSSGSMSVDIYLPQGAVTLKIHDDMKEHKKALNNADSEESQCTKFSQRSEFQSFDNEDESLLTDLDDSVFINQDAHISTPQIVLEPSESKRDGCESEENTNVHPLSRKESSLVEQWAATYHSTLPPLENKSDSMEVQTPMESPSPSLSTNFSFDCSEPNSAARSIDSVISNPLSSRMHGPPSLSQTDTSFYNVSSLASMGSSQDVSSPLVFCGSPKSFDFTQESAMSGSEKNPIKKLHSFSETTRKQVSITLDPDILDKGHKTSPRKHSSLESAQIQTESSPKRHQLSLESSKLSEDLLFPPRFLSPNPMSPTATSPPALTFSPRKVRSESLPERRQAPSIKRFPLMRQGALDSFAEEGGSTHRLDRSMTQIPKE